MIPWRYISTLVISVLATSALAQNSVGFTSIPLSSGSLQSRWLVASDRHLQANAVGALLLNSTFAHGYRHGYDQGFSSGDLDVHMGRTARQGRMLSEYRQWRHEYKSSFGNRQSFQEGYETGFKDGYADAMAGLEYRASQRSQIAAAGLSDALAPSRRQYFDEGFASGYRSAQSDKAPRLGMSFDYLQQYCERNLLGPHPPEYCSGFTRGYLFGNEQSSAGGGKVAEVRATR